MSLFPVFFRSMRPSSWMEQQLKMMQHIENVMSPSLPRHPAFHVEWHLPQSEQDLVQHAKASLKGNQPFEVKMEIKNFSPNEITVKAIDNNIIVEGKHEERSDEKGFISRHFVRTYTLPEGCFAEDVHSCLQNGILTITAPNKALPEVVAKEIPIDVQESEKQ